MYLLIRFLIFFASFLIFLRQSDADTYNVKIGTEHHVNVVDSRFLSFTVDPKYLFASSEKYYSKQSTCMAAALSPAYLRIAGPSTSSIRFTNSTISFTDLDHYGVDSRTNKVTEKTTLSVSHAQWQRFVHWARQSDFHLVFALNSDVKTDAGLWDPNAAISILTVADEANVTDIYWQLGYECRNQTIEEYLNDLQTLRVIAETFPERDQWRVVAGDVTPCLRETSNSDFKDYVTLSEDLTDAVLLNGNSSAQELERMSERDRLKLLKLLSVSETPLWLTESANYHAQFAQELEQSAQKPQKSAQKHGKRGHGFEKSAHGFEKSAQLSESAHKVIELKRAADWMSSLGYSARNGFAVHFRELVEEELYEPSLSFYMALLFKNLVGDRVLEATMEAAPAQAEAEAPAVLFAHCTSLRGQAVPGAVSLFGANMGGEPARLAVRLSRREHGGDIMQFILGHDSNGNIVVNGRAMYHEGDIRPVVKRVRPYKTLLLNLPPKSFGFWVLANTNIAACYDEDSHEKEFIEAVTVQDDSKEVSNKIMTKRSMLSENDEVGNAKNISDPNLGHSDKVSKRSYKVKSLKERVRNINKDLKKVKGLFKRESDGNTNKHNRVRRQLYEEENESDMKRKLRRQALKSRIERNRVPHEDDKEKPLDFIRKLITPKLNGQRLRHEKSRKLLRLAKNKLSKRNSKNYKEKLTDTKELEVNVSPVENNNLERKRRSILDEKQNKEPTTTRNIKKLKERLDEADSTENEINSTEQAKLWKMLHKIHEQLENLPDHRKKIEHEDSDDEIVVTTKLLDDSATIKYQENLENGLVSSTLGNVVTVLKDVNKNLNKFWRVLSILD